MPDSAVLNEQFDAKIDTDRCEILLKFGEFSRSDQQECLLEGEFES
jgi:hypothetical protein